MLKKILKDIKDITLLYVEDDNTTREELVYFLENRVSKLLVAKNGKEGFELYKQKSPDIVLTDVQMPKLDGIGMSKLIKDYDPDSKIIVLTAFNDSEYLFEAIKTNIDMYKTKPVDLKDLIKGIAKLAKQVNLEKENKIIFNTLKQYKDIVDERSIVSKTNKNGIITYVNEPFEEISGYKIEELIGKTHAVVKHPDTEIRVFEDMWDTILEKKVWTGVVKNKNKNGDDYIVDTIVKPILDVNGEIVEFISLRNDITDLETSKKFFKQQSEKISYDLKESIRKAKIYKDAINESNMIVRVSQNRTISYVNESFLKVSGYIEEEIIGQDYSFIRDYRVEEEVYQKSLDELQKYLDEGNIWKGKTTSTKKDGSLFHCNLTIYPIRDEDGNIYEYMGIRHDITEIENLHTELEDTQREIIYKLGEVGEVRSKETGNHVKRVAHYSRILAEKIGLGLNDIDILFSASPMHDIGKIGIPDEILNKPGKLTDSEWDIMKTHAEIGYKILESSKRPILKAAAIVSYTHHEKWNGKGYPNAISGEDIHIFGRITAIADVFDALGTDRVYKKAWPLEKIIELFKNQRGKHFDPQLVDIFLDNLNEFLIIRDKNKD